MHEAIVPLVALILVIAAAFFLYILPIIIIATNKKLSQLEALAWCAGVVFFGWLAFIIYLFLAPSRD
jgi:hypothetical protein